MTDNKRIMGVVFKAIDEVNRQLPREAQIEKSTDAVLFDKSGRLDSLGLIKLIVATEQNINKEFNAAIKITDEKAMSQRKDPFKTTGALIDYISYLLKGKK